jgi:hypothetical protein
MKIKTPLEGRNFNQKSQLNRRYLQFQNLLMQLKKENLDDSTVLAVHAEIDAINLLLDTDKSLCKRLKTSESRILKLIEKEHQLVTKNHHRKIWLAVGMGAFGIPMGIILGVILDNMGFITLGMPLGLGIGIAIGTMMDQKAAENEKQLDIEIKY